MQQKYTLALIELRPTRMLEHQIGVFAFREIKRHTVIGEARIFTENVDFFPWSEYKKFDKEMQERIKDFCLGTPHGFYMPLNFNHMTIGWHMNHRCNPNVGFNENDDFIVLRDVHKGEELCWDYGMGETNPRFRMKCKCGSSKCRGMITGNDWKKLIQDEERKKYMLQELVRPSR
jgi:hypothetical protein